MPSTKTRLSYALSQPEEVGLGRGGRGKNGPKIKDVSGGATIDAEARATLNDLLVRLRANSLIS